MTEKEDSRYLSRIDAELKTFKAYKNIHDLPDIYHYWSNKYLRPKLQALGIQDIYALFVDPVVKLCQRKDGCVAVASLGSGNCDFEINIVSRILEQKVHPGSIEVHCYEPNQEMSERGYELALMQGMSRYLKFIRSDLNGVVLRQKYDVFIANQSLHNLVNLEHIFESILSNLEEGGYFIVSSMIGRNGHMLWPDALDVVLKLWSLLGIEKKWNHQLKRYEKAYENWDCSTDGFEGIRCQDILPLLVKYFKFETFYAFANIIDVFIGRSFGRNFNQNDPFDQAFIDFVARLDEKHIREGKIKPTHLMARMVSKQPREVHILDHLTPEKCLP